MENRGKRYPKSKGAVLSNLYFLSSGVSVQKDLSIELEIFQPIKNLEKTSITAVKQKKNDPKYGSLIVSEDWAKSQIVDQMQEQNRSIEK